MSGIASMQGRSRIVNLQAGSRCPVGHVWVALLMALLCVLAADTGVGLAVEAPRAVERSLEIAGNRTFTWQGKFEYSDKSTRIPATSLIRGIWDIQVDAQLQQDATLPSGEYSRFYSVTSALFKIPFEYTTYKYDSKTKQYSFVSEVSLLVLDSSDFDLSFDFGAVGDFGCSFVMDVNIAGFSQREIFLKQNAMKVFRTMKGLELSMGGGVSGVGGGLSTLSGNKVDYGLWPSGARATPPEGYADVVYGGDLYLFANPQGLASTYKLVRFFDTDDENRKLKGAVADGAASVIVEIIGVKASADVTFPAGDGQWVTDPTLTGGVWRRVWQAPSDFGSVPTAQDKTRPIAFEINVDGAAVDPPPFYLYRAPVVLLHGALWGDLRTWEGLEADLRADGYSFVLRYPYANNQSLKFNKGVLKDLAEQALEGPHMLRLAARKVDVVGYSYGGLVAKYDPANSSVVRRVVTVGTPHCGSPLANWVCESTSPLLMLACQLNPALKDMKVKTGGECIVPGNNLGPGVPAMAINGIWNGSIPEVSPLVPGLVVAWMALAVYDITVFGTDKNDLVVSETSQKGGLANTQDVNNTWHIDEPNNSTVKSHVLDFLDKSLSESALQAASGLADSLRVRQVKAERPQANAIGDGAVTITSPAAGTVCSPGAKLHVSVQTPPRTTKVFVGIDNGRAVVAESPPFEVDLTVPAECLGEVTIGAIAWNGNATLGIGETSVHVSTTATVSSLAVLPSSVIYLNVGQSLPLTTTGTFSDGATRLITASVFGTTYESSKPAVASVTADGVVTGLSDGYCVIKVRNGDWQVNVPVLVERSEGGSEIFSDVPSDYWAYDYIIAIYDAGITTGCAQDNPDTPENERRYCPEDSVTRGQMAAFIIRSKFGENFTYTTTPYFSDVPSGHVFFKYVQKMKDEGITVTTGTYMVDDVVTREQMAAFIIRSKFGENFTYTQTPYFSDVPSDNVFFKYVQKMKDEGITTTTGTYMASSNVTREQMAAFLARAFLGMQ
jgi:pimeloyl-ACP methyl ester carboxylesterase